MPRRPGWRYKGDCEVCGAPLNKGKRFCSATCREKLKSQQAMASRVLSPCPQCGKDFYRFPSDIERGEKKFCSKACYLAHRKANFVPKTVPRVCKQCGKDFTIPFCYLKKFKNPGQYCSRECWNEYMRANGGTHGGKKKAGWGQGEGSFTDCHGYVHEYDPIRHKFVRQHRLVMERMLGRPLEKGEKVHHKNGKRGDNAPENLELILGAHFSGKRVKDVYAQDIERLALENHKLKLRLAALENDER